jgi:hypothetical protein
MAASPIQYSQQRAPRVKLAGSILVLLQLEDRSQVRARLNQLSVNGGVLQLSEPLQEEQPVEVMFHIGSTTVRAQAATISPMWATQGCLQPFRFTAVQPETRQQLATDLESFYGAETSCESGTRYEADVQDESGTSYSAETRYEPAGAYESVTEYEPVAIYNADTAPETYEPPVEVLDAFVDELDDAPTPNEVVLYFDRPEDAMHFTVALSSVIFNDATARTREDITKLAREIAKISRVTTKGTLKPAAALNQKALVQ